MQMPNRARLLTNAVAAGLIGSTIGALAGVWSAYRVTPVGTPPAKVATMKTVAASSSGSPVVKTIEPTSQGREPQPPPRTRVAVPTPPGSALTAPSAAPKVPRTSADDVLERARALAQRPDVKALIALRENVVVRATARGEQDSPAAKAQLDALDHYLDEARMLRLKIDAVELQKSAAEPTAADKQPSARR